MENQNIKITIPEPCHEDWNKMIPDEKGKFCDSCNKSVHDFSNKTDLEIRTILLANKDRKVCGHFKRTQIDRPLNFRVNFKDLPKNVSTTKVFAMALFLVFGSILFSCTMHKDQPLGEIEIVNTDPKNTLRGEVEPLCVETITIAPMSTQSLSPMMDHYETHVAGGLSIQNIEIAETIDPVPDSVLNETFIVGQMAYFIPGEVDSVEAIVIDSSSTLDPKENLIKTPLHKHALFSIYPNPSNGEFTIKYEVIKRADVKVEIYDMAGALVKTVVDIAGQYQGKYQIPVSLVELPNGIYIVNLVNNGELSTEKVIMEK